MGRSGKGESGADETATRLRLPVHVTCPHCWQLYPPEDSLWISSDHPSLRGDAKLGEVTRRFPAERFHVSGDALDATGRRCSALACPNCHLEVPRVLYEYRPFFVSIVGAPAAGKSFLLGAMTWTLRTALPRKFRTAFLDADPASNLRLHEYERDLFLNPRADELVAIEKTRLTGMENLYDQVMFSPGEQPVSLPRPFIFRLEAAERHPDANRRHLTARAVCLYDNAGESFLASARSHESRSTEHLGHSHVTMFLFDPTQDMRFRRACRGRSEDPQMQVREHTFNQEAAILQHTILENAAARMRKLRNMAFSDKHDGPLVVIVTKLDAWGALLPNAEKLLRAPLISTVRAGYEHAEPLHAVRMDAVQEVSNAVRSVLVKLAPEVIGAAEGFSSNVTYVPCSATGRNVQKFGSPDPNAKVAFGIRPRDIKPFWCELPFLVGMAKNQLPVLPVTKLRDPEQARDVIPMPSKRAFNA
jgi:hypothetical protein